MEQSFALLRIFTDEAAMSGDERLFEAILKQAHNQGLLGGTVVRGSMGFGHESHIHSRALLDHNNPVIVEIVDEERRVRSFAAGIANVHGIGLMTLTAAEVLSPVVRNEH